MTDIPLSWLYRLVTFQWNHNAEITGNGVLSGSERLEYGQIKARPELDKGFFWADIIFPSSTNGPFKISGIRKKDAPDFFDSIICGIQDYHQQTLAPYCDQIPPSYQAFRNLFNGSYVRHSAIEKWKQKSEKIYQNLDNDFALENLQDSEGKQAREFILLASQSHTLREDENQKFITSELQKYGGFFDTVENNPLTVSFR